MPANFPSNPTLNQQYSYLGSTWSWSGSYWQLTTSQLVTGINFTYANTAPVAPNPGDRWVDTTTMLELVYVYDGNSYQWIELSSQAPSVNFGSIAANIVPAANITYDLGTTTSRWRDLYLSGNTLYLGAATVSATGSAINLPAGSTVAGATVATSTEVSTGGGPKITNVQVTNNAWTVLDDTAVDIVGGYVKITGTNFVSGCQVIAGTTTASAVSFISSTELRVQFGAVAAGTYVLYVSNPDGGVALRVNGITFSATPAWQTASSLGEIYDAVVINLGLVATSAVNYVVTSGSLPPGLSLTANTGVITGTVTGVTVDTTYNFTVTATDAEFQDSPRSFSVTVTVSDPYFRLTTLLLSGSAVSANTVVKDSSTNNFNLTVAGDARASNFTPYGTGWSVQFDGSGDSLAFPDVAALNVATGDFTIEMWIYFNAFINDSKFYVDVTNAGTYWQWNYSTTNGISFNVGGGFGFNQGSTTGWTTGTWYHVAFVRNASTFNIFRNGNVVATGTSSASIGSNPTKNIGGWSGDATTSQNAYISNARFVKGVAVYTGNFVVPSSALTITQSAGANIAAITGSQCSFLTGQSNRFVDVSNNTLTVTRNGDARVVSFNPFNITNTGVNGSAYFDGSGDSVSFPVNSAFTLGTNDFTIEAWIYPNGLADNNTAFVLDSSAYPRIMWWYISGAFHVNASTTGSGWEIDHTPAVVANQWNHLVFQRNGNAFRTFLNGTVVATTTLSLTFPSQRSVGYVGRGDGATQFWNGYISNCRVLNGTAVYNTSGFAPPTSPLTAITNTQLLTLQYDQPHNNHTFLDSSSNQFLITRSGNASQGTFSPFSQSGWSVYFDGSYDCIKVASDAAFGLGTGNFTIELWVNFDDYYAPQSRLAGQYTSGNTNGWQIHKNANSYNLIFNTNTADHITYNWSSVATNTWYHIAVVRSGTGTNQTIMYINGVNVATGTCSHSVGANQVVVGGLDWAASYSTKGYISSFRYSNIARTIVVPTVPYSSDANTLVLTCQSNRFIELSASRSITIAETPKIQAFSPFAPTAVYNPVSHGGSAYFDGTGDYLTVSSSNIYIYDKPFTFASWVYGTAANFMTLLSWGGGYGNFRIFYTGGNTIQLWDGPSGLLAGTPSTLTINQWFYIVVQRDANNLLAIYHNGVLVTSTTNTGNFNVGTATFAAEPGGGSPLSGYMSGCQLVLGAATYTSGIPTAPPTGANDKISLLLNFTDAAVIDSTGRNVVETKGDARTNSVITKFMGGSMYFDGTADGALIPHNDLLHLNGDFTIELWFYANAYGGMILNKGGGSNIAWASYELVNNSDGVNFAGSSANTGYDIGSETGATGRIGTITLNTWNHLAVTRSGNVYRGFVNGVQGYTQTLSLTPYNSSPRGLAIGHNYATTWATTTPDSVINGYIADLRISRYARYTANFTAPTGPARLK